MSTTLHIVDPPKEELFFWIFKDDAGAMFRWEPFDKNDREAWCIVLPNGAGLWWTTYEDDDSHQLWDVSGEPPNITVSPSINAGVWHGFITDGVMTP